MKPIRIITKIKVRHIAIVLVYALWFLISYICLASAFSSMFGKEGQYSDGVFYLALDVICMLYILLSPKKYYQRPVIYAVLLVCVQIFGLIIAGTGGLGILIMRTSSWCIVFLAAYKYLSTEEDKELLVWLVSIGSTFLSFYIAIRINEARIALAVSFGINELYLVFMAMPLLFLLKNKLLRALGITAMGLMVILSLKSTALLALLVGIVVFMLIHNAMNNKKTSKMLLVALSTVCIIIAFLPMINEFVQSKLNINWIDKIISVNESGGSGRIKIWAIALKEQGSSGFFEWIFGHGYNTLIERLVLSGHHFSAHNDFIEALYDFGLVGLIVYIGLYVSLISSLIKKIREKSVYAAPLGMSIAMFFVMSMFSHLLIVPSLLVNYSIVWAVCLSGKTTQPNFLDTFSQR